MCVCVYVHVHVYVHVSVCAMSVCVRVCSVLMCRAHTYGGEAAAAGRPLASADSPDPYAPTCVSLLSPRSSTRPGVATASHWHRTSRRLRKTCRSASLSVWLSCPLPPPLPRVFPLLLTCCCVRLGHCYRRPPDDRAVPPAARPSIPAACRLTCAGRLDVPVSLACVRAWRWWARWTATTRRRPATCASGSALRASRPSR